MSDSRKLSKRQAMGSREWILRAIDEGILVDAKRKKLLIDESNFDEIFDEITPELIRQEIFSTQVEPYLTSIRNSLSKLRNLRVGLVHNDSQVFAHRFRDVQQDIEYRDIEAPLPNISEILGEVSTTLVKIHEETRKNNNSASRKWWVGFCALVFFTFFGANVEKVWSWCKNLLQWMQ